MQQALGVGCGGWRCGRSTVPCCNSSPSLPPPGNATFTYNVTDRNSGAWAIGAATIQVAPCPVPLPVCPVKATNDLYTAPCGVDSFSPLAGQGLLVNDYSNATRPDLIVSSTQRAQDGAVDAWWPNGTFVFTRAPGFVGERLVGGPWRWAARVRRAQRRACQLKQQGRLCVPPFASQ